MRRCRRQGNATLPLVDNPFQYARPVPPSELIDREREAGQLLELLRAGHNCRLSAPRRYGKTSLIYKTRADAERDGSTTVYVNFYGILSLDEAVARIERGYRELRGPLRRWLTGKLSSLEASISTPVGGISVAGARAGPETRLHELLDLPRGIFSRTGERVLVCFDEFQEVLSTRVALDGAIRSVIEHHADEASYLFAGSHPGMMAELFDSRERPFFGQARPVALGPLRSEDLAEYIGARFEQTRRDPGDALRPLLDLAQGHPQRAMLLAHFLWERTGRGTADEATFADTLDEVFGELSEAFDRAWQGFDDGERRTLAAVALSGGTPTQRQALATVELPRTTAVAALERLIAAGHLHSRVEGRVGFVDPLLGRWVATGRGSG
jgi:hypothetical protein